MLRAPGAKGARTRGTSPVNARYRSHDHRQYQEGCRPEDSWDGFGDKVRAAGLPGQCYRSQVRAGPSPKAAPAGPARWQRSLKRPAGGQFGNVASEATQLLRRHAFLVPCGSNGTIGHADTSEASASALHNPSWLERWPGWTGIEYGRVPA